MPKILVVDDEAVLVKGIKFNLENEGVSGGDGMRRRRGGGQGAHRSPST